MYRKILLAYDGTLEGRTALREGALLARRCGAQIYLLSVMTREGGMGVAESVNPGSTMEHESSRFRAILNEGVARLTELGMRPVARLVSGEPATEIRKFAKEVSADLVVVGHRRQSLLARWWSGSTGAYILDNIDCSLLIARKVISDEEFNSEFHK
jgi:nucleotide-binding universal stress UspA family protein